LNLKLHALTVALSLLVGSAGVSAAPVTFNFSQGNRAAQASFTMDGSDLVLTLTNTSTHDVLVPVDVLTGLFFTTTVESPLTRLSANLGAGSSVMFGSQPVGGDVGGEWAYRMLYPDGDAMVHGVSAAGLGLFGPGDRFNTNNLNGQANIGGLDFGILSAGDNPLTGNTPVTGKDPLIDNSVVFRFGGLASSFNPATEVLGVVAVYGTSLSESPQQTMTRLSSQSFSAIPTPSTLASGIVLMMGLAGRRWRRAH
jgi:hypothetical protein